MATGWRVGRQGQGSFAVTFWCPVLRTYVPVEDEDFAGNETTRMAVFPDGSSFLGQAAVLRAHEAPTMAPVFLADGSSGELGRQAASSGPWRHAA